MKTNKAPWDYNRGADTREPLIQKCVDCDNLVDGYAIRTQGGRCHQCHIVYKAAQAIREDMVGESCPK
jgi:hypothetical protein